MFSDQQLSQLGAKLQSDRVKTRDGMGYIEAWDATDKANEIFGFDGWDRFTISERVVQEIQCEVGKSKSPGYRVGYVTKVRVVVRAGDTTITKEGTGGGQGIDRDLFKAHEGASKEAESDAMKRALTQFGNQFGLALYDKTKENVTSQEELQQARIKKQIEECEPWHQLAESMVDMCKTAESVENWWGPKEGDTGARRSDLFFQIPDNIRDLFFPTEVKTYRAKLIQDQAAA